MPDYPIGDVTVINNCCPTMPGTTPPATAPYVFSLNSLYGIINIIGNGALTVTSVGNDIQLGISASAGLGSVTSVGAISGGSSLVIGGSPVTTNGNLTFTLAAGLQNLGALSTAADKGIYTTASNVYATFDLTSFARTLLDDASAASARTTLGGTTVGSNLFTLTNPSAVNFIRINADNTVTGRTAANMRTDLGLVIGTNVQAWANSLDQFVSFASFTGGALNVLGLNSDTTVSTGEKLQVFKAAGDGSTAIIVTVNSVDVFTVMDNGITTITPDPSVSGSLVTVAAPSGTLTIDDAASLTTTGFVNAFGFTGEGSGITSLDATQLTTGTVPAGRLTGGYTGITQVGTLTAGTWNASAIAGQYGGTGVANTGKTITLGGNLTTSGAFATTLTVTAATAVTLPTSGTLYGTLAGSITSAQLAGSLTDETGSGSAVFATSPSLNGPVLTFPTYDQTVTAGGTTGAQTINKSHGTVNFAIGATSIVVTNSLVTANTIINATVGSNDATMKTVAVVATGGSFTLYSNAAATAETRVNWSF